MKNVTDRQKKERARRKAMGIALIQRPLRYIAKRVGNSIDYLDAYEAAKCGDGATVKHIARSI